MLMGDKNSPKLPHDYPKDKWEANCRRVWEYKEDLKKQFSRGGTDGGKVMEYEKFLASIANREVVLTTKYDGELQIFCYDQDHPFPAWFNKYVKEEEKSGAGKIRTDITPLSQEISEIFKAKGITQIVLMGELYALSEERYPLPFGDTASILLTHDVKLEQQIYFAVFDILEMNGKPVEGDYWTKCLLFTDIFKDGKHVHPVFAKKGNSSVAKQMWQERILDGHYEGFVVRSDGAIKVKPIHNYDLAVIGFEVAPGKTWTDSNGTKVKTLVLAWIDSDGTYRFACNCGNGLDNSEQTAMATELIPKVVRKDVRLGKSTIYFVEPTMVVQIACGEVLPSRMSESWKWGPLVKDYISQGVKPSAALRFPKFDGPKIRRDKSATNPSDCRLEQIPDWGEPEAPPPFSVTQPAVVDSGTSKPTITPTAVQQITATPTLTPSFSPSVPKPPSGFVVGQSVSMKDDATKKGEVRAVNPPAKAGRKPTYIVDFDGTEIEVGESVLVGGAIPQANVEPSKLADTTVVGVQSEPSTETTPDDSKKVFCIRPLF